MFLCKKCIYLAFTAIHVDVVINENMLTLFQDKSWKAKILTAKYYSIEKTNKDVNSSAREIFELENFCKK